MRTNYYEFVNEVRGQVKPSEMPDIFLAFAFLKYRKYRIEIKDLFDYANSLTQLLSSETQERINKLFDKNLDDKFEIVKTYYNEKSFEDFFEQCTGNTSLYYLVYKLLKLDDNDRIYDMGSGIGHFLYEMCRLANIENKKCVIQGIEINTSRLNVAKMILELIGVRYKLELGDALYYDIKEFDKAFVFPPLGLKYKDDTYLKFNTKNRSFISRNTSAEWFFVDRIISNLPDNGRAVALLPQRCLFFEGDHPYRRYLLESKMIEGIIKLPQGVIPNSGVSTSLVIFSHNNEKVNVVDASNCFKKTNFRTIILHDDIACNYFTCKKDMIDYRDIICIGDMSVEKLLRKPIDIKYSTPIENVGEVFQGSQYTLANFKSQISEKRTNTRLLTSSDIEEGMIQWDLLTSIENPDKKIFKFSLRKNDVILTSKSSKVKIAIVDCDLNENLILTGGMLCVRPNTNLITPEYLKMFFDSKKGREILKSIQKGSTIPSITVSALKSINVSCPPIDIQIEVTKKYQSKLMMYAALKKELVALEEQISSYYDEIEEDL